MLPSKAERILSRYRPIAPKPLPLPPSGSFANTDPSSTCASIDSFTSSAKCKKSRKRKADDSSSARGLKPPKSFGSGVSYTGAASSLTQGVSEGTVPLRDLRSPSQLSYGSIAHGIEECAEMSNGATQEARSIPSDRRFAAYSGVVTPLFLTEVGNMVQSQGLHMSSEATLQQQQQHLTLLHQPLGTPNCASNRVIAMERDTGFMERAAASSSSVMPERSSSVPVCDVGCAKGVGYVGGGFTEMIRGITRLPTAADVQSLMQARASAAIPCGSPGAGATTGSPGALRLSPTSSKEMAQRKFDCSTLSTPISHTWILRSPTAFDIEPMRDNRTELVTLPLLPNVPSRMCSSSAVPQRVAAPSTQNPSLSCHTEMPRHNQLSPRIDQPSKLFSSRSSVVASCPSFASTDDKAAGEIVIPSVNSAVVQIAASLVMADGAAIDGNYLEQVYGGSTDPVLLLYDSKQVLWYNKSYDKALKSASERLSGKTAATGPYIDPLGHPTPLGTFLFPRCGAHVQATLWGFLKKLVIQENEMLSEHGPPSSQLRLSMEGAEQRPPPADSKSLGRSNDLGCTRNSQVTMMTLESVTETHMDVPAIAESIEGAEVRLGAGNAPAFITDCLNRVRWVNAALREMLGKMIPDGSSSQPLPSSKAVCASVSSGFAESSSSAFVICCTEKVPRPAWAFSCRVNIEWVKGGRRRSMTVPCDVIRVISSTRASEVHWAWQFDMAGSLCLNAPL